MLRAALPSDPSQSTPLPGPQIARPRPMATLLLEPPAPAEPAAVARFAGLRYVQDGQPGIRRRKSGRGFSYVRHDGTIVRDTETLARIRSLAIPPAWADVWICTLSNGHIQAAGRDVKGRKQYRYHPKWREVRDETKFHRMASFGLALSRIRQRVEEDLGRTGLPRDKVLATVVRLLETTCIRVGNEEYARQNGSYGLTTMKDEHVEVRSDRIRFRFPGKSGREHVIDLNDRRLARIVRRCQELPGEDLFAYLDESGAVQTIGSGDVNEYIREISGQDFTAKDFRTWNGTVLARLALRELGACENATMGKRNLGLAIRAVAETLGNTPTVCRKFYIYPAVLESYLDGSLFAKLEKTPSLPTAAKELRVEERELLHFLLSRITPGPAG